MKHRFSTLLLLTALACAILIAPLSAAAAPSTARRTGSITVPVATSGTNALGELVTYAGNLTITRFATRNGQLTAIGTLTGTATNTVTGATQTVTQAVAVPVIAANGSCTILDLTLGPIHLDLLGLVVDLN